MARQPTFVLWILFLSFIVYIPLTWLLSIQNAGNIRFTFIFEDTMDNTFGLIMVLFYATVGLYLTYYFYKRALATEPTKAFAYATIPVITGVAAPYIYALLLSFMGIMRDILPLLFISPLYIMGIIVGFRIIPDLTTHLKSD